MFEDIAMHYKLCKCATIKDYQAGHWGFIEYRPPKKTPEYRPNIDHTALYRPNIDRKSSLKSAHLQYLLLSPEIYIFWENEALHVFKRLSPCLICCHLLLLDWDKSK